MSPSVDSLLRDALQRRYACKTFDTQRKIGAEDWQALKDCLRLAPSYYGLQPWRFLVIENEGLRRKLRQASWDQPKVTDCSHFVVITVARKLGLDHVERYAAQLELQRGTEKEASVKRLKGVLDWPAQDLAAWAERQSFIPLGFAMLGAATLGLDSCPMEGIEPEKYDQILGLTAGPWKTVAGLALGYHAASDKNFGLARVRFSEEEVFQTFA